MFLFYTENNENKTNNHLMTLFSIYIGLFSLLLFRKVISTIVDDCRRLSTIFDNRRQSSIVDNRLQTELFSTY